MTNNHRKKRPIKITRNITKKSKPTEETLEQRERKFRALLDTTGTGYVILDSNGRVIDANPEYVRLTGHRHLDEIAGRSVAEWTAPHHRDKNIIEVTKCVEKGCVRNLEIDYIDQTGHITPVEINATFHESNVGHYILSVVRDITERKKAETALHESEKFLRIVIDLVPHFIFVKDEQSRFLLVNKSVAEAYGTTTYDIIGKSDINFSATPEEAEHFHKDDLEVISGGIPKMIPEEIITDSTGKQRYLQTVKIPFRFGPKGIPGILGVAVDITERKKAEEILEEKERELEIKANNLEEANVALRVLLNKRDEDKAELEDKVLLNIKGLVNPYLEKLKMSGLDKNQKVYVTILESSLTQVTSSFLHRLSFSYSNFTPTEIQVANLLKQGKTNKEIGELLNSSSRTIAFHRDNIRKKLGLKNKKTNLKSYLLSLK